MSGSASLCVLNRQNAGDAHRQIAADRARFRKIIALKNSVGKPARPWR